MAEQPRCQPQGEEIQNPKSKPDGCRQIDEEDCGHKAKRCGGCKVWPKVSDESVHGFQERGPGCPGSVSSNRTCRQRDNIVYGEMEAVYRRPSYVDRVDIAFGRLTIEGTYDYSTDTKNLPIDVRVASLLREKVQHGN
jgi:hypothetical protein